MLLLLFWRENQPRDTDYGRRPAFLGASGVLRTVPQGGVSNYTPNMSGVVDNRPSFKKVGNL